MAIDLGTATRSSTRRARHRAASRPSSPNKGPIRSKPSARAKKCSAHAGTSCDSPMKDGRDANFEVTEKILPHFPHAHNAIVVRPRVVTDSVGNQQVERRAVALRRIVPKQRVTGRRSDGGASAPDFRLPSRPAIWLRIAGHADIAVISLSGTSIAPSASPEQMDESITLFIKANPSLTASARRKHPIALVSGFRSKTAALEVRGATLSKASTPSRLPTKNRGALRRVARC